MLLRRLSNRLCAQCWYSKSVIIRITFRLSLPLEAADSLSAWCSTCGSSRSPSDAVGGSCGLCTEVAGGGRASTRFQSLERTSKHAARTHVRLIRHDGLHKASCSWLIVAAPPRGGGARLAGRRAKAQGAVLESLVLADYLRAGAKQRTLGMKVSPTEQEGLREQSSTSAAPGRRFKVNDHSVRIPLAVVKLMRQPVSASVQEVVPRLWPRYLLGDPVTCLLALAVVAVPAAPWTQGLGPGCRTDH